MTTLFEETITCCVCETQSPHKSIRSTSVFGSPDLDTRPPEMQRSTIYYSIQRCPSCGYCSHDLSESIDDIKAIVESDGYQAIINRQDLHETATSFLALAYESEVLKDYSSSAWQVINAAWVCDDQGHLDAAVLCRKQAIALIHKAEQLEQQLLEQEGATELVTIDLMRRSGMHKEALVLAEKLKSTDLEDIILKLAAYQETLIHKNDADVHTVAMALDLD